ncbi:MAG: methyl-accepting chemotaxis protein [Oceanicoccus sp.]
MNGLLAPAIALMNKLSYAKKFGVISITFFVPLLLLSYAIVNQTYEQIKQAEQATNSLIIVNDVLAVAHQVGNYRDLSAVDTFYQRPGLNDQVRELEKALFKAIVELKEKYIGTPLAQEIERKEPIWRAKLKRSGDNKQPTISDQFKNNNQVLLDVHHLATKIAQDSGVLQDTNEKVQLLLKLILQDYTKSLEVLGFANTMGVYSIVEKYIMTGTYDTLNETYDLLDAQQKRIQQKHTDLLSSYPEFSENFSEKFKQSETNIESIKFKLDEEIISAASVEITWFDFNDFFVSKLPPFYEVQNLALQEIQSILSVRVNVLMNKLITVVVAISLVMLLIVYLYAAFFWSVRSTVGQFHSAARKISQGDMRIRVSVASKDEMGELTGEFNIMVDKIHELLQAVHKTSTEVGESMKMVGGNADQSYKAANEQLHQTEQVASAITEMAATAEEVNRQSADAAKFAAGATSQAGSANEVVTETLGKINNLADEIIHSTEVINQLSENSSNIANMLAVIKGIAEQTNLLALNAAIEAARAGEQGRGFAVVADEVRTLASRTQKSAQEIDEVMTTIHTGISDAVGVMGKSHEMAQSTVESSAKVRSALDEIVTMIKSISDINGQISVSADEQTQVAKTIDENVIKINDLGRATVEDSEHTVKAIKEVVALTHSLQEKLERFQV